MPKQIKQQQLKRRQAPSKTASRADPAEEVVIQAQAVEQCWDAAWRGGIFDEPLGGQADSKKLRLLDGLCVLLDEMDCVYLDVYVSDEMNATSTHESIAKTMKRHPEPAQ